MNRDEELARLQDRYLTGELTIKDALLCAYIAGRRPIAPTATEVDRLTAAQIEQWRAEIARETVHADRVAVRDAVTLAVLAEILVRLRWGEK